MTRRGLCGIPAGLILLLLSGCGSGTSAPFAVSCTTHSLTPNLLRAAVTVSNSTSAPGRAYVYGPIFNRIRHFYPPTLFPHYITVKDGNGTSSYPGFVVAHVRPNHPTHLIFRFARAQGSAAIAVSNSTSVQAGSNDPLTNSGCTVG